MNQIYEFKNTRLIVTSYVVLYMKPSDSELLSVKNTLNSYKNKIIRGEELDKERDKVEIDVEGGRIHVHPATDGTTVTIHYINDDIDEDPTFKGTGEILHHITGTVNFPREGDYTPNILFTSASIKKHKIDFAYFIDD